MHRDAQSIKADLERILDICIKYQKTVNFKKLAVAQSSVKWNGLIITQEGYQADPDRWKKLLELEINSVDRAVKFYHTAAFWRRFIPDFARRTRELRKAVTTTATWTDMEKEIIDIKKALTDQVRLSIFDPNAELIIYTDWSTEEIGATISQERGILYFWSRTLTGPQLNYGPTEGECVAIREVCDRFYNWIAVAGAKIFTDHQCLVHIKANTEKKRKFARMMALLDELPVEVIYCPGEKNIADLFSRTQDPSTVHAIDMAQSDIEEVTDVDRQLKLAQWCHITFGHLTARLMVKKLKKTFDWRGMASDCKNCVQNCKECRLRKAFPVQAHPEPRRVIPIPFYRVHSDTFKVTVDLYAVVFVDAFSGWPEVQLVLEKRASSICRAFKEEILARHGAPVCIVFDNGPEYDNAEFDTLCSQYKIIRLPIVPGVPQMNGKAERMIGLLKQEIKKIQLDGDIRNQLNAALLNIRFRAVDKISPFHLLYGRLPVDPRDVFFEKHSTTTPHLAEDDHVLIHNPNDLRSILLRPGEPWRVLAVDGHAVWVESTEPDPKQRKRKTVSLNYLKKLPAMTPSFKVRFSATM
ncbi:MAG: hypothetical protein KVP17_004349, partial [Porospora cf. gigantea B]